MGNLREIFVNNIKYFRKEKRYSQEKLSYALGMGMNYINQIENKASFPSPEIIEKIAHILEIQPFQLFCESTSPANIESAYFQKYSTTLHDELISEIIKTVTSVCEKINC